MGHLLVLDGEDGEGGEGVAKDAVRIVSAGDISKGVVGLHWDVLFR